MVSAKGVSNKKMKNIKPEKSSKVLKLKKDKTEKNLAPVLSQTLDIKPSPLLTDKTDEIRKKSKRFVLPSKSVTETLVQSCVEALQKLSEHYKKSNRIFDDETAIFAEINCIKIQNSRGNIKFVLPHSTISSTGEVCLITPDLKKGKKPDHEPTIDHWQELLQKANINEVKTVLPMRQLRVEYDQFELKRRLLTQHDFIMVDTKVLNHVSHVLGKMFFKKHNMLIPVRLDEKNLKKSVEIGLRTVMLRLSVGVTSTVLVGHTGMAQKQIKENVLSLVQQLNDKFPGGERNIRSLSLKLPLSLPLPLYVTLRPSNTMYEPKLKNKKPKNFMVVEDELSTIPGSRVSVGPDGTIHLIRNTNNEDSDMDEDEEEKEEQESEDEDQSE